MITVVLILAAFSQHCVITLFENESFYCLNAIYYHCNFTICFVCFGILRTMKGTYFVIVVLHLFILHYFGILIGESYSKASTIHKREVIKHVRFKPTRSGNIINYIDSPKYLHNQFSISVAYLVNVYFLCI